MFSGGGSGTNFFLSSDSWLIIQGTGYTVYGDAMGGNGGTLQTSNSGSIILSGIVNFTGSVSLDLSQGGIYIEGPGN